MRGLSICGLLVFYSSLLSGQHFLQKSTPSSSPSIERICFTNQIEERLQQKYPERLPRPDFENRLKQIIDSRKSKRATNTEQVYRIPTIVHVIHSGQSIGNGSNISQAQVNSQFDVLNEDFRRLGNGFNNHPDGADILVEFYPVTRNPQGEPITEPGIDRVASGRSFWEEAPLEDQLKPSTIWDPDRYFNIWVLTLGGDLDGVLGYAQFPSLSGLDGLFNNQGPANTDGVVIDHRFFGSTGTATRPYDLGRTATHEVGHWLGLIHIWGDGGCEVDDYCEDTPNAGGPNGGCRINDSCTGDSQPDMIENYMDYTDDACMNIFTQDQKMRMRTVLENSPRRNSLIGPVCDEATVATMGATNTSAPAWHTFTSTESAIITVSSLGQTDLNTDLTIYSGCSNQAINRSDDAYGTTQSELSTLVDSGDELKIYWSAKHDTSSFTFTITSTSPAEGAVCELANNAVIGQNTISPTDKKSKWYTHTMSRDLSRLNVNTGDYYYRVYTGHCKSLSKAYEGSGTSSFLDFAPGQQIWIEIEANGSDFSWELEEIILQEGEVCQTAKTANLGTNSTPSAPYWFAFTMPKSGELFVSSTNQNAVKTYGQLYAECGGNLVKDNNPEGDQTLLSVPALQGAVVYILWDSVFSANSFEWELSIQDFEEGIRCESASQAQEGTNTSPQAPFWHTFTMPRDANLKISSEGKTGVDTYLVVLDQCEGGILAEVDDTENSTQSEATIFGLLQGESVKIYWSDEYSSSGFDWTLEVVDPVSGESCDNTVLAQIGENQLPADFEGEFYWFRFKVPENDKKYVFSSETAGEYIYMLTECEADEPLASGFETAVSTELIQDQEIFIIWEVISKNGFNWSITAEDLIKGDICQDPLTASEGNNTSSYAPAWYSYTIPESGDLFISSRGQTEEDTYLQILNSCNGEVIAENDDIDFDLGNYQSEVIISDLQANDEVLIHWASRWSAAGFDWNISMIPEAGGNECENAAIASLGTNTVPALPFDFYWTKFTIPESNKRLDVTSNSQNYVYLVADCFAEDIIMEGLNNLTYIGLAQGDEIYIVWETADSDGDFTWDLSLSDLEPGDLCQTALPADIGINNASRAPKWYTYTMPKPGDLLISTANLTDVDTDLLVYTQCNENPIDGNDDINPDQDVYESELLLEGLEAGEEILIQWLATWSTEGFEWLLEPRNIVNEAPIINDQSFSMPGQNLQNGHEVGTIMATDPDGDALAYFITSGDPNKLFDLNETSGMLTLVNADNYDGEDMVISIEVSDGLETSRAIVSIQQFILHTEGSSGIRFYPNPASTTLNIDLSQGRKLKSGRLINLGGEEVLKFSQPTISLLDLPSGLYLLQLTLNDGTMSREKIVIRR